MVAPAIGEPSTADVTVPAILPQVLGGFTVIDTPTGATLYGVSVLNVMLAVYVPGWVMSGTPAFRVTVIFADLPGCRVSVVGLSDSQDTSATASQSVKPGSTSAALTGGTKSPPGLPPTRYRPHALPPRYSVWLLFGNAAHESSCGLYAYPLLVIEAPLSITPPE